jgi:diguanylate cyclase (GGDEF)-like protein
MKTGINPFRSKISRVLVLYVLLFSSVITLVLTALQLYNDYRYDLSLIDQRLDQIRISNLESLSRNLWTLNDNAVKLQLEGLLKLPDMVYLEITAPDGGAYAAAGIPQQQNMVSRTYPISYRYRDKDHDLGSLKAVATLENVYQRLLDTFIVILITQGIKTFLVSAFIVFLVTHTITRHLSSLSAHARRVDPGDLPTELSLDRKSGMMTDGDELEQLVSSYNQMQRNIRHSYAELAYSESLLAKAQQIAHIGSWEYDASTRTVNWSEEALSIAQCAGLSNGDGFEGYIACTDPADRDALREGIRATEQSDGAFFLEHRIVCDNGDHKVVEFRAQLYTDQETGRGRLVGTIHDVTEPFSQREALHRMANFDSLTDLPNRWLLNQRVNQTIESCRSQGSRFMFALMDLDGFKEVNDSLGHHAGDQLLRQIKPRLARCLRQTDMLARLGGDEFGIILVPVDSVEQGQEMVAVIVDKMNQPFDLDTMQLKIGASVGISLFPDHADDASTLLRYADVAMYHAKRSGIRCALYSSEIDSHTPRRLELISALGQAVETDQLFLNYQPKVETAGGRLIGVEALVRWQHPVHGIVGPDEFIPLCEISDIIRPLTLWVIARALEDNARCRAAGFDIGVSVNASVRNMLDSQFAADVMDILQRLDAPPGTLSLEITESALMEDPERARAQIDVLHNAGVSLSIDDFGTGYSSLSYLKHLPVQELKIDRSFVFDMLRDENDAVIVKSTIDLAHSLGIYVTAEGVENGAIVDKLQEMQCDRMQGFHLARPMAADLLLQWLKQ